MITLYGLRGCDTCRKATRALGQAGHEVTFVDLRETPVSPDRLRDWWDRLGPDLLNRRSTTWRGLPAADRACDPLALLQAHPALIKRPVLDMDGTLGLGWTPAVQARFGVG